MYAAESLSWLTTADLITPVLAMTDGDIACVDRWSSESVIGGAGEVLGVWRVTGEATVDGTSIPFTLILKGWPPMDDTGDPTGWNWPPRELSAYTSGMLDDLPGGIRAPRCLGSFTQPDGSTFIWLSPMSDGAIERWDLEHYAFIARRLGAFNGAYLTGQPTPDAPWLSRQWTRQWVEAASGAVHDVEHLPSHPVLDRVFPPEIATEIQHIWEERYAWLDTLETLPQTFCHLDAFKRNTFLRPGADGEMEPGLIDWGFTGIAAVGEEIGPLVTASLTFEPSGIAPHELDRAVFDSYVAGLRDAGWQGDAALVRMGYIGSMVLRYGVGAMRMILPPMQDETAYPMLEQVFRMSLDDLLDHLRTLKLWLLELADEFRRLRDALPPTMPDAA